MYYLRTAVTAPRSTQEIFDKIQHKIELLQTKPGFFDIVGVVMIEQPKYRMATIYYKSREPKKDYDDIPEESSDV